MAPYFCTQCGRWTDEAPSTHYPRHIGKSIPRYNWPSLSSLPPGQRIQAIGIALKTILFIGISSALVSFCSGTKIASTYFYISLAGTAGIILWKKSKGLLMCLKYISIFSAYEMIVVFGAFSPKARFKGRAENLPTPLNNPRFITALLIVAAVISISYSIWNSVRFTQQDSKSYKLKFGFRND